MISAKIILLIMMSRLGVSSEVTVREIPYDSMVKCQEAATHNIEAICLQR